MRNEQNREIKEKRMPISEHLNELRARLIICIAGALLGTVLAYGFYADVFYPILRAPLDAIQGSEARNPFVLKTPLLDMLAKSSAAKSGPDRKSKEAPLLHYQALTVPFIMRLKVSFVIGLILVLPLVVYEVWAFVSAGLYAHERKFVRLYGPMSFVLFVLGSALAYFVVLPLGVVFLMQQGEMIGLRSILTIDQYAPFVMWLLLGFGLVFQTPLVILFLTKIGLVTPATLAKYRRHAILGIFIVSAVMTPPDPFTQIAMAIPMIGLYEFSLILARLAVRRARSGRAGRAAG